MLADHFSSSGFVLEAVKKHIWQKTCYADRPRILDFPALPLSRHEKQWSCETCPSLPLSRRHRWGQPARYTSRLGSRPSFLVQGLACRFLQMPNSGVHPGQHPARETKATSRPRPFRLRTCCTERQDVAVSDDKTYTEKIRNAIQS